MAIPKPSPKTQNSSPIVRMRWPSMPRNDTDERSGNCSAASPPPASPAGWANAEAAVRNSRVAKAAKVFESRNPSDARVSIQVRIKILQGSVTDIQGSRRVIYAGDRLPEFRTRFHRKTEFRSADLAASEMFVPPVRLYDRLHTLGTDPRL